MKNGNTAGVFPPVSPFWPTTSTSGRRAISFTSANISIASENDPQVAQNGQGWHAANTRDLTCKLNELSTHPHQ